MDEKLYLFTYSPRLGSREEIATGLESLLGTAVTDYISDLPQSFLLRSAKNAQEIARKINERFDYRNGYLLMEVKPDNFDGWISEDLSDFVHGRNPHPTN